MFFYGWIPTLTDSIFLRPPYEDGDMYVHKCTFHENEGKIICKQPHKKEYTIKIDEQKISKELFDRFRGTQYAYVREKNFRMIPEKKREDTLVLYLFHNKECHVLQYWYCFDKIGEGAQYEYVFHVDNISLEKNGFINFSLTVNLAKPHAESKSTLPFDEWSNTIEKEVANQAYRDIRDMYHKHTHHRDEGSFLVVSSKDNRGEAIQDIIDQFQEKIIKYHERINRYIYVRHEHFLEAIELVRQARGEFLYAQNFCSNFGRGQDLQIFESAIKSMAMFLEESNARHSESNAKASRKAELHAQETERAMLFQNKLMIILTLFGLILMFGTLLEGLEEVHIFENIFRGMQEYNLFRVIISILIIILTAIYLIIVYVYYVSRKRVRTDGDKE